MEDRSLLFPMSTIFPGATLEDQVRQSRIDMDLDPPEFDEIKDIISVYFTKLSSPDTPDNLQMEIISVFNKVIETYPEEMYEHLEKFYLSAPKTTKLIDFVSRAVFFYIDTQTKVLTQPFIDFIDEMYKACISYAKNEGKEPFTVFGVVYDNSNFHFAYVNTLLSKELSNEELELLVPYLFENKVKKISIDAIKLICKSDPKPFLKYLPTQFLTNPSKLVTLPSKIIIAYIETIPDDEFSKNFNCFNNVLQMSDQPEIFKALINKAVNAKASHECVQICKSKLIESISPEDFTDELTSYLTSIHVRLPRQIVLKITDWRVLLKLLPILPQRCSSLLPAEVIDSAVNSLQTVEEVLNSLQEPLVHSRFTSQEFWEEVCSIELSDQMRYSACNLFLVNFEDVQTAATTLDLLIQGKGTPAFDLTSSILQIYPGLICGLAPKAAFQESVRNSHTTLPRAQWDSGNVRPTEDMPAALWLSYANYTMRCGYDPNPFDALTLQPLADTDYAAVCAFLGGSEDNEVQASEAAMMCVAVGRLVFTNTAPRTKVRGVDDTNIVPLVAVGMNTIANTHGGFESLFAGNYIDGGEEDPFTGCLSRLERPVSEDYVSLLDFISIEASELIGRPYNNEFNAWFISGVGLLLDSVCCAMQPVLSRPAARILKAAACSRSESLRDAAKEIIQTHTPQVVDGLFRAGNDDRIRLSRTVTIPKDFYNIDELREYAETRVIEDGDVDFAKFLKDLNVGIDIDVPEPSTPPTAESQPSENTTHSTENTTQTQEVPDQEAEAQQTEEEEEAINSEDEEEEVIPGFPEEQLRNGFFEIINLTPGADTGNYIVGERLASLREFISNLAPREDGTSVIQTIINERDNVPLHRQTRHIVRNPAVSHMRRARELMNKGNVDDAIKEMGELKTDDEKADFALGLSNMETPKLREIVPLNILLKAGSYVRLYDISSVLALTRQLLADKETLPHLIKFYFGKSYNPFCVTVQSMTNSFMPLANSPEAFQAAIGSMYESPPENQNILFMRNVDAPLPPPSEYAINLLDSVIRANIDSPDFGTLCVLFVLAQHCMPLFSFTTFTKEAIFRMIEKASEGEPKDAFAAGSCLDYIISLPDYMDEFIPFTCRHVREMSPKAQLIFLAVLALVVTRRATSVTSMGALIREKWPSIATELLKSEDAQVTRMAGLVTERYFAILTALTPQTFAYVVGLVESDKNFERAFGGRPIESQFKGALLQGFLPPEYTNRISQQFTYQTALGGFGSRNAGGQTALQLLKSADRSPSDRVLPLPPSISEESFSELSTRFQSIVLQRIILSMFDEISPQIAWACASYPIYVSHFLQEKPRLLYMPEHYLLVFDALEKAAKSAPKDLDYGKFVSEMTNNVELLKVVVSRGGEDQRLLQALTSSPAMVGAAIEMVTASLKNAGPVETEAAFKTLISLMSSEPFSEKFNKEAAEVVLETALLHKNRIKKTLEYAGRILAATDFSSPRMSQLVIFLVVNKRPNFVKTGLALYSKLGETQKSELDVYMNQAFSRFISLKNNQLIALFTQKFPNLAQNHTKALLEILNAAFDNALNNMELIGSIMDALGPAKNPTSSLSVHTNTSTRDGDQSLLPIPQSVVAQAPEFWAVIADHIGDIQRLVKLSPNVLNNELKFLLNYPILLPFEDRVRTLRQKLQMSYRTRDLKLNVSRATILQDTFNQLGHIKAERFLAPIHVKFNDERGVDAGGPKREWFTQVVQELFNPGYCLFNASENGLSYEPNFNSAVNLREHIQYFKLAGRIIARAVFEGIAVDAHLTQSILKKLLGLPITLRDLEAVDESMFNSLKEIRETEGVEDMYLTFSRDFDQFGRNITISLKEGGEEIDVTDENKEEYVRLMVEHRLYGQIQEQVDAFTEGFHSIIPKEYIASFTPNELDLLICGIPTIDVDDLWAHIHLQRPYSKQSPTIIALFNVLKRMGTEELAKFFLFATGSSRVPVGGFEAMERSMTIEYSSNTSFLPVAHTCMNMIDLPDYRSEEVLEKKLLYAINNCNTFEII